MIGSAEFSPEMRPGTQIVQPIAGTLDYNHVHLHFIPIGPLQKQYDESITTLCAYNVLLICYSKKH